MCTNRYNDYIGCKGDWTHPTPPKPFRFRIMLWKENKKICRQAQMKQHISVCKLPWIFYILFTFFVLSKISYIFINLNELRCNKDLAHQVSVRGLTKRSIAGKQHTTNVKVTLQIVKTLALSIIISWLYVLLVVSGDVHPNPGPLSASSSNSSLNTTYMSSSLLS